MIQHLLHQHLAINLWLFVYLLVNSFLFGFTWQDFKFEKGIGKLIHWLIPFFGIIMFAMAYCGNALDWIKVTLQIKFWWQYVVLRRYRNLDTTKLYDFNRHAELTNSFNQNSLADKHLRWIAKWLSKKYNYVYKK